MAAPISRFLGFKGSDESRDAVFRVLMAPSSPGLSAIKRGAAATAARSAPRSRGMQIVAALNDRTRGRQLAHRPIERRRVDLQLVADLADRDAGLRNHVPEDLLTALARLGLRASWLRPAGPSA